MSQRRKLTVKEPKEEEDGCTGTKMFFGIFNSLFWVISIGILGLAAWQASGSPTTFTGGTAVFTYGMLAVSIVAFIMCILGFLASLNDQYNLAGAYVILFVLLLATEGGLILACYVMYPTDVDVMEQVWSETTPFIIEKTESELQCCGFTSWNDTYSSVSAVPAGCIDTDGVMYPNGCSDAISTFFTSVAVWPYFLFVLALSALIQLLAFIGGSVFFHKLRMKKNEPVDPRRDHSRNAIVPIMVSPVGKPSTSQNAASRGDIQVSVDSPNQQRAQGNEALFKIAGTMLDE